MPGHERRPGGTPFTATVSGQLFKQNTDVDLCTLLGGGISGAGLAAESTISVANLRGVCKGHGHASGGTDRQGAYIFELVQKIEVDETLLNGSVTWTAEQNVSPRQQAASSSPNSLVPSIHQLAEK